MAKMNYQKLSRDTALQRQPVLGGIRKKAKDINSPVMISKPDAIIPFGKYKGKMMRDVPIEYIVWAIQNLSGSVASVFVGEVKRRDSSRIN